MGMVARVSLRCRSTQQFEVARMSAFGGHADMPFCTTYVCFRGYSGHRDFLVKNVAVGAATKDHLRISLRWRGILDLKQSRGNHMAKKRKSKKNKIKRKRAASKNKPEKGSTRKVVDLTLDVPDEALEREGGLSFTRYGCP